jgi:putative Mn2+ efflux pump MntP
MQLLEILALAVSMAMDAFTVSLAAGTMPAIRGLRPMFRLTLHFAPFQFPMPMIGWLAGAGLEPVVRTIDHWVAFALLGSVGVRMIDGARDLGQPCCSGASRGWALVVLSAAVSIDALAVGVSLGVLDIPVGYPALAVGVVTGMLSWAGLRLGTRIQTRLAKTIQLAGGLMLIGIGGRLVVQHILTG